MAKKQKKEKKGKREILVAASYLRRAKDALFGDTTGVERFNVFKVSMRIGRLLSGPMIVIGAFLLFFSAYFVATDLFNISLLGFLNVEFLFTPEMRLLIIGVIGLLGAINTLCGLILLARE